LSISQVYNNRQWSMQPQWHVIFHYWNPAHTLWPYRTVDSAVCVYSVCGPRSSVQCGQYGTIGACPKLLSIFQYYLHSHLLYQALRYLQSWTHTHLWNSATPQEDDTLLVAVDFKLQSCAHTTILF
jgi:hypothetical protein